MAARTNRAAQEAELQRLREEGRALQRTLATATSDYGIYLKKYNDTSERILADTVIAQQASTVTADESLGKIAIVLVLVDGTSHKLHNELYRNKNSGGAETAKRLRVVVRERIAVMLPAVAQSEYHIVIKFFACLKSLSSRAATDKLTYPGVRSPAQHFAEFTKVSPFFDFVDTGDEGQIPHRISENLKLYMAIEQCKHVFFCAAGSPKYYSALEEYRGQTRRVTPVTSSVADGNLSMLGLHAVSFGKVFKAPPPNSGTTPQTATDDRETLRAQRQAMPLPTSQQTANSTIKPTPSETSEIQITPGATSTPAIAVPVKSHVDASSATREAGTPLLPSPLPTRVRHGRVPINLAKERLDLQMQLPTPAELQAYKERTKIQELCIDFHLRGHCMTKECKLSHGTLISGVFCVLQYKALGMPCPRGSGCRDLSCVNAHVCQKDECARAGGKASLCGLDEAMHKVDPHVAEWVVADDCAVQSGSTVQRNVAPVTGALVGDGVPAPFMEDLISF